MVSILWICHAGGTANCTDKFGKDIIYNPQQEEPDVLIVMNNPSFEMFIKIVATKWAGSGWDMLPAIPQCALM